MISKFLNNNKDIGILILRLGFGIPFVLVYGMMKVENGPVMWTQIGSAMGNLGINFLPAWWGFMATLSEFGGGILIILGLFLRPAVVFMAFTMIIATITHLSVQDQWYNVVTPIEMFSAFTALLFLGAGKYSIDHLIFKKKA